MQRNKKEEAGKKKRQKKEKERQKKEKNIKGSINKRVKAIVSLKGKCTYPSIGLYNGF